MENFWWFFSEQVPTKENGAGPGVYEREKYEQVESVLQVNKLFSRLFLFFGWFFFLLWGELVSVRVRSFAMTCDYTHTIGTVFHAFTHCMK